MSLQQLDAFLAHARQDPELRQRLQDPSRPADLQEFLALARSAGFSLTAEDVIAAHQRAEDDLSDEEIQRRALAEARRLRTFIPG
ncbi:MAG: Nif11-like leader peptide family natural product precursor [Synechococcaceae cyanobacterium]|nr:Nif11-like leader peptide family natural product precursor [Synechococcaceae cyanobacterium]